MRVPDIGSIPFRAAPAMFAELKPSVRPVAPPPDGRVELRRAADRLVAGQVRGPIGSQLDVTVTETSAGDRTGPLSLHARPADRHAAATGVELGRRIDVTA